MRNDLVFKPAGKLPKVSEEFRQLISNGVNQGDMNLRNPTKGAARLHKSSSNASEVLVRSLKEGVALDSVLHKQCVRKAGIKARKERCEEEKAFVKSLMEKAPKAVKKRLERMGETGTWLTVTPNKLNGTILWRTSGETMPA